MKRHPEATAGVVQEPAWTLSAPRTQARRSFVERLIMAVVLPGVAGSVNGIGFAALGVFTSHMTGNVTRVGDDLSVGDYSAALSVASLVAYFCCGAFVSTLLVERSRSMARARYVAPLLCELTALCVFASLLSTRPVPHPGLVKALLCFAMGAQNAMVTQISSAVVRTTHLTGVLTDGAMETARVTLMLLDRIRGPRERSASRLSQSAEWKKLELHLSIMASFVVGAFVGPELYLRYAEAAMLAPCTALAALCVFDLLLGIRGLMQ